MKEIGGYMEFEHYRGMMLHDNAIKLNSGRNCLAYLIKVNGIKKIALPYFLCDCIYDICRKNSVKIRFYHIGYDFLPIHFESEEDEWLYLVNYYGQLSIEKVLEIKKYQNKLILDNSHAYFELPSEGIDTLYTCRKYFGVSDGGILYSDKTTEIVEQDESYKRCGFLIGRFEKGAEPFFASSSKNEEHFYDDPIRKMSRFTDNILHSINYEAVLYSRIQNFRYLHEQLEDSNELPCKLKEATFMYPFMISNAKEVREKMIENKIFIPVLWPNVLNEVAENSIEWNLTRNILPLPIDQRYEIKHMKIIVEHLRRFC